MQWSGRHHVINTFALYPRNVGHSEGFGHSVGHCHTKEIIEQLNRVPRPQRTKVKDVLAQIFQHRFNSIKHSLVTRRHDV